MSARTVAFFASQWVGHVRRQLPLITRVTQAGATAYVYTDSRYREMVEDAGGRFVDLFEHHALTDADAVSLPRPLRYVTWAALYAEEVAAGLRERGVELVVYDTFAVVGRAAATALGVPYVNVVANHGVDPDRPSDFCTLLAPDPRLHVGERCLEAVEVLRERYGIENASPYSYISALSPYLNIVSEPPEFVSEELRRKLEPVTFMGSLPDGVATPAGEAPDGPDVYVSFGTITWRYFLPEMLTTLRAFAAELGRRGDVRALVSLGHLVLGAEDEAALRRPNVAVERWVDQWRVLAGTGVFVTHHGMNSTHEAVWHGVPMIGWPVLGDQPGMAATARRLGLSVLLGEDPHVEVTEAMAASALDTALAEGDAIRAALAEARGYEERVMAGRGDVVARLLDLRV